MFVTFYSYKGGVGRSMALANIACLLAQDAKHPQKVLLWDFDLEAPGLHKLFPPPQPQKYVFVDLVDGFLQSGKLPDVEEYIYTSSIEGIDVLPAGTIDQSYCDRLRDIHWPDLFNDDPQDPGPFFGPLKRALESQGYDYILIDSRTGLNDQSGICTQVLPDLLVVLFRLTSQNMDGLQHVVPMIRTQLEARKRSNVRMLPIASAVSPSSSEHTHERKEKAEQLFYVGSHREPLPYIRFDIDLVTDERLFCLKSNRETMWPRPAIIDDYEANCRRIRKLNANDTSTIMNRIKHAVNRGDILLAASQLLPTLLRRQRDAELWKILMDLYQAKLIHRNGVDDLVETILKNDAKNPYCYEWKAFSLLDDIEDPDSPTLGEVASYLELASEYSEERPSLVSKLARIESCQGRLERASALLRSLQERSRNSLLHLELAMIFVRMGASYFALAIDTLERIPDTIEGKLPLLSYLLAFLGRAERAKREFARFALESRPEWELLCRAHLLLAEGDRSAATEIAASQSDSPTAAGNIANWSEFFICAGDFDRACSIIERSTEEGDERYKEPLTILARFLRDGTIPREEVVRIWDKIPRWGFTELLLFRERALREGRVELSERLSIVEELIRRQELRALRVRGPGLPGGASSIRIASEDHGASIRNSFKTAPST